MILLFLDAQKSKFIPPYLRTTTTRAKFDLPLVNPPKAVHRVHGWSDERKSTQGVKLFLEKEET